LEWGKTAFHEELQFSVFSKTRYPLGLLAEDEKKVSYFIREEPNVFYPPLL